MATASIANASGTAVTGRRGEGGSDVASPEQPAWFDLDRLEEGHPREEFFTHDTEGRGDHTFNGIMMDLICRGDLPCEYLEVQTLWVRGELGPLTVYAVDGSYSKHYDKSDSWTVHYKSTHEPSFNQLVPLQLDPPKRIIPGQRVGFYVHSTQYGDQSIVYDDAFAQTPGIRIMKRVAPQPMLQVTAGLAHLSPEPFGGCAPGGRLPWRRAREFVGRINYCVRWLCWSPSLHSRFPPPFKQAVRTLLMCAKRPESRLSEELIFVIVNRGGWDWFGGDMTGMWPHDLSRLHLYSFQSIFMDKEVVALPDFGYRDEEPHGIGR